MNALMTPERAAEILNPEHRECYESIETVKEACRMGMNALQHPLEEFIRQEVPFRFTEYFGIPDTDAIRDVVEYAVEELVFYMDEILDTMRIDEILRGVLYKHGIQFDEE